MPKNETGSFLFPQRQMCTMTGLMHGVQTSMNTSIGTTSNENMSKANSPRCVKERLNPYINPEDLIGYVTPSLRHPAAMGDESPCTTQHPNLGPGPTWCELWSASVSCCHPPQSLSLSLLGTPAHAQSVHSQGMPLHVPQSTAH